MFNKTSVKEKWGLPKKQEITPHFQQTKKGQLEASPKYWILD